MNLGPYEINQIYCGDCAVLMREPPDACIDLTVTSPPYDNLRAYRGYKFNFEAIANELFRVTKIGGVIVWIVGDETANGSESGNSFRQALYFMDCGFRLHDTMIYAKNGFRFPFPNRYHQVFEYMFIFSRGSPKTFVPIIDRPKKWRWGNKKVIRKREKDGTFSFRKVPQDDDGKLGKRWNIWPYDVGGRGKSTNDILGNKHPAIFPEALARDHILSWSNPGDLVFDPMMGSGTTAKMAKVLERNYLGFDTSEEYVELARKRLENTGTPLPLYGAK